MTSMPMRAISAKPASRLNQYTATAGTSLVHDANGNLTQYGAARYAYDVENRLTSASGSASATLLYDPLGRLYRYTANGKTIDFAYAGDNVIGEYQGTTLLNRYLHIGALGTPVMGYVGSGTNSADRRYFFTNRQGSVIATAPQNGDVAAGTVNTYDAYGVPGDLNSGRFGYTGQMWLAEVGLYHYRARAYHPGIGRFLQTDPVGYTDQMNLYAYVHNDPLSMTDPTGMHSEDEMLREVYTYGNRNGGTSFDCICLLGAAARQFASDATNAASSMALHGAWGLAAIWLTSDNGETNKGNKLGEKRKKTKDANKKDKKQVDDAARERGVKDRKGFGEFMEKEKKMQGRGGSDNFDYDDLLDLADEFNELGGY